MSGEWANGPSPQMEVSFSPSVSSSIRTMSAAVPLPWVQPVRISTIFCEPIRQGTHLPHDSLRKNFTAFSAISSMHRPSAHTTRAPEPSMDPMAARDLKSSRTSTCDAGKYPDDGPDGANAFNFFPPTIPPPRLKITSDIGRPIGISNTPGLRTSPLMPTNLRPEAPPNPCDLYQSTPFTKICGTLANVSTLFSAVGL